MKDSTWEVQKAVYAKLKETKYPIWDRPDVNTEFPFITIYDTDMNVSLKGENMQEINLQVHLWSRYKGKKEIKEMKDRVLQILIPTEDGATLTLIGFRKESIWYEDTSIIEEPENDVIHGIMTFKILTNIV